MAAASGDCAIAGIKASANGRAIANHGIKVFYAGAGPGRDAQPRITSGLPCGQQINFIQAAKNAPLSVCQLSQQLFLKGARPDSGVSQQQNQVRLPHGLTGAMYALILHAAVCLFAQTRGV